MTITSTYEGEVQLSAWGENRDEMWVRFKLDDGPDGVSQNPFKPYGKERKRFMLVAVPIADDETPEKPKTASKEKTEGERAVQRAGILCGEPHFQHWFAQRHRHMPIVMTPESVASGLRAVCGVASRKALATNEPARQRFLEVETEYRRDTGQLAEPRG